MLILRDGVLLTLSYAAGAALPSSSGVTRLLPVITTSPPCRSISLRPRRRQAEAHGTSPR